MNIFDSTNIQSGRPIHDPDLGAPNSECPGGGPGKGDGGEPGALFPNCEPQGNLMIIQNESIDISDPNDTAYGGCLVFEWQQPINLVNVGLVRKNGGLQCA